MASGLLARDCHRILSVDWWPWGDLLIWWHGFGADLAITEILFYIKFSLYQLEDSQTFRLKGFQFPDETNFNNSETEPNCTFCYTIPTNILLITPTKFPCQKLFRQQSSSLFRFPRGCLQFANFSISKFCCNTNASKQTIPSPLVPLQQLQHHLAEGSANTAVYFPCCAHYFCLFLPLHWNNKSTPCWKMARKAGENFSFSHFEMFLHPVSLSPLRFKCVCATTLFDMYAVRKAANIHS